MKKRMTDEQINAHLALWDSRIEEFIRTNRDEIYPQLLRWLSDTTVPTGLYNVLVAYCAELVGPEEAFKFSLHWVAKVALRDLRGYRQKPTPEHFPIRLKLVMEERRLQEMPMPSNLKGTTLNRYLEGKTTPTLTNLAEIAADLGVSPAWLAFGIGLPEDHTPSGRGARE
ncbi:transcriptional regulator with XRE-family HTH domain [Pseudomonas nitritireducens]|uniref:Transcriptional regulator with XRE-family HTH domain n=1 Tax=Pseudomonas nitroreducens TaxID=46680 RepID=A0A7W7P3M3_PSENT|nr:helix-turn-helix transcriptional regulator [Pseudomonas nitritireducens]MBB4867143.1 transcriptional regulator with XRE-family HTH domain [Pseudomonas nitritireducens]